MILSFETSRLLITAAAEHDVADLLAVALSNPKFTLAHEGSDGEPGRFDREMLERDLAVAWMDPARHPLVIRSKSYSTRVIGWAEVLEEHPRDLVPWIGLLEVHKREQRKGYGAEATAALVEWARTCGAPALRLGVDEGNAIGMAFWQSLGFQLVDQRERMAPAGPLGVSVLEVRLDAPAP